MRAVLGSFEQESQKPGQAFHEFVRQRRREMGLPLQPEERVLPFRSCPLADLPAIDAVIDEVDEIELVDHDEHLECLEFVKDIPPARKAQTRAVLRRVRRLEELELAALESPKYGKKAKVQQRELDEAYEHELGTYNLLRAARPEWA